MFAVESVFKIDDSFSDQVVASNHVVVVHWHCHCRVQGKRELKLEHSKTLWNINQPALLYVNISSRVAICQLRPVFKSLFLVSFFSLISFFGFILNIFQMNNEMKMKWLEYALPIKWSYERKVSWAIAVTNQPSDVKCRFDSSFDQFLVHSEPLYVFVKRIQSPK